MITGPAALNVASRRLASTSDKHMTHLRSLMVVAALTAVALPTFGQQSKATPAAAPAATAASASKLGMNCAAAGMKPHNHAAEKGMGTGTKGPHCDEKATTLVKAKKKPLHDHGKENKQQ